MQTGIIPEALKELHKSFQSIMLMTQVNVQIIVQFQFCLSCQRFWKKLF